MAVSADRDRIEVLAEPGPYSPDAITADARTP